MQLGQNVDRHATHGRAEQKALQTRSGSVAASDATKQGFGRNPAALVRALVAAEPGFRADVMGRLQREQGNADVQRLILDESPTLAPGSGQSFLCPASTAGEGHSVQRQLPERPVDRTATTAGDLRRIIVSTTRPGRKLTGVSRILGGRSKEWLRGIEVNYSRDFHQVYVKVDYPGTPAQFHHFEGRGRLVLHDSPLRGDLRSALGMSPSQRFIAALEEALPLRPPPGRAVAQVILDGNQRRIATSRAIGEQSTLARWLFKDENWVYLVGGVGRWAPSSGHLAGFFELPAPLDRARWPSTADDPRTGDKEYLTQIQANMLSVKRSILERQAELRTTASLWMRPRGLEGYQKQIGQILMTYREELLVLRSETDQAIEKLIPFKFIWGPKPKTTRDLVRRD